MPGGVGRLWIWTQVWQLSHHIYKSLIYISVIDVGSDFLLSESYNRGGLINKTVHSLNDSRILDQNNTYFGNATSRLCTQIDNFDDGSYLFSCKEYHHWFAVMTLVFIYLPSVSVVLSFYGPTLLNFVNCLWGGIATVVGGLLFFYLGDYTTHHFIGKAHPIIGALSLVNMVLNVRIDENDKDIKKKTLKDQIETLKDQSKTIKEKWNFFLKYQISGFLFYPVMVLLSPFLLLVIKFLSVFKPKNEFIKHQARSSSRGESIFESTPQIILQLYIVFFNFTKPSALQVFGILSSALSICICHLKKYEETREHKFGLRAFLKNILFFSTHSIFRVLSVSIFLSLKTIGLIFLTICYWVPAFLIFFTMVMKFVLKKKIIRHRHQIKESIFLGWINLTNLENTKTSAKFRLYTSAYTTIVNSLGLTFCLILVHMESVEALNALPFVQDRGTFQILIIATVLLGVMSWIIDIITAVLKLYFNDTKNFYEGSVLLEGWKYINCCGNNISK